MEWSPKSPEEAVIIAEQLHELTWRYPSPAVPYDRSLQQNSCIYYRYGAFGSLQIENPDGTRISAIKDKEGKLVPDRREPGEAVPKWVTNPFPTQQYLSSEGSISENLLQTMFLAYEALSQRGKGGVYRALDLSTIPARLCVLKEGRRHGETDLDGRDGYWRIEYEAQVLSSLALAGIAVPKLYKTFALVQTII